MPSLLCVDARLYQILCLSLFLGLGVATKDWTLQWQQVGAIGLTCLGVQLGLALIQIDSLSQPETSQQRWQRAIQGLPSALITGLGLSLLLRADQIGPLVGVSAVAIASKFWLRLKGKHLFNPANFGIVMGLLSGQVWVSPGQWGEAGWYALLILGAGSWVLRSVGRWDTTVAFLSSYAVLEAVRNLWLGWTWDVWLHRLSSGSLLLFAFFMITDPRTVPDSRLGRVGWAVAIASLTFVLRNLFFLPTAVLWALFLLAPCSGAIDHWLPGHRFTWLPIQPWSLASKKLEAQQTSGC
jgi:Na+-transporting NADH:ubiquinone oxidoreductase subunit NqrB